MSKKMLLSFLGEKIAQQRLRTATIMLTMSMILLDAIPALSQPGPIGYTISGYVKTSGGAGVASVTVKAVGTGLYAGTNVSDTTSSSGYYSVRVPDGFDGYAFPSKTGYTFSPSSITYRDVMSNKTGQNYTASIQSSIKITSPNGGEQWVCGTTQTITWTKSSNSGSYVKIELYKGGDYDGLITNSTSNDGAYNWSIPASQTTGSNYKIKITSTSNTSYYDYSDYNFSITSVPSISITSPNGGEQWQCGTSYMITWISSGTPGFFVKIELYRGETFNRLITNSTSNDGSYNWFIPSSQTTGSNYKIRITSTSNTSYYDYSDDNFFITAIPLPDEVVFEDSFSSEMIDQDKWPVVYGATIDNIGVNEPSPEFSLRLNGHPSGGDEIESRIIDLSSCSGSTLTYHYERTGQGESPEAEDDLIIDYHDGSSWIELDRQPGDGADMDHYDEVAIALPPAALHAEFKLRIRSIGTFQDSQILDDWFVDDVKIVVDTEQEPAVTAGSLVAWGSNLYGQCNVPTGNDYVAVSAGGYHSLALKSDGSIVGWGQNADGQATPPAGNNYVAIAAGHYHSLALKSNGSIRIWGGLAAGLGNPPEGNDFVAVASGSQHSLALKSDGSIVGWGHNNYGQATPPEGNDFVAIAAADWTSLALKSDGSIVGWGLDDTGQATPPRRE